MDRGPARIGRRERRRPAGVGSDGHVIDGDDEIFGAVTLHLDDRLLLDLRPHLLALAAVDHDYCLRGAGEQAGSQGQGNDRATHPDRSDPLLTHLAPPVRGCTAGRPPTDHSAVDLDGRTERAAKARRTRVPVTVRATGRASGIPTENTRKDREILRRAGKCRGVTGQFLTVGWSGLAQPPPPGGPPWTATRQTFRYATGGGLPRRAGASRGAMTGRRRGRRRRRTPRWRWRRRGRDCRTRRGRAVRADSSWRGSPGRSRAPAGRRARRAARSP